MSEEWKIICEGENKELNRLLERSQSSPDEEKRKSYEHTKIQTLRLIERQNNNRREMINNKQSSTQPQKKIKHITQERGKNSCGDGCGDGGRYHVGESCIQRR